MDTALRADILRACGHGTACAHRAERVIRRPLLRYHGGKWRLAPWIISHFPTHRVYTEVFGGAASVLLRKPRSYSEVYNDLSSEVVTLFRVLRSDRATELIEAVRLTPYARSEFEGSYERDTAFATTLTPPALERARRKLAAIAAKQQWQPPPDHEPAAEPARDSFRLPHRCRSRGRAGPAQAAHPLAAPQSVVAGVVAGVLRMKLFITKYALSSGIRVANLEPSSSAGYFVERPYFQSYKLGRDCHASVEEAQAAAKKMRASRIESLNKQIAKLEKLTFEGAP